MVLVFMFAASWRLTVVTFIIIPVILAVCKLYGQYYRYNAVFCPLLCLVTLSRLCMHGLLARHLKHTVLCCAVHNNIQLVSSCLAVSSLSHQVLHGVHASIVHVVYLLSSAVSPRCHKSFCLTCSTKLNISVPQKLDTLVCRMLAKQVQTELAQANSVADEALATMTTVRAHAADDSARAAYAVKLAKFYNLQACAVPPLCWPDCMSL